MEKEVRVEIIKKGVYKAIAVYEKSQSTLTIYKWKHGFTYDVWASFYNSDRRRFKVVFEKNGEEGSDLWIHRIREDGKEMIDFVSGLTGESSAVNYGCI